MMPYPHLKAWKAQEIEFEAWNLPTCGCKSMMERPTNKLGVFIALLCTYTKPNKHYSSTWMIVYTHLMAKLALKFEEKRDFS